MQLEVNLLGQLHCYPDNQPKKRKIDCPDGSSISQIANMLGLPQHDIYNAVVGNSPQKFSYQPKEGDEITFIPVSVSG